MFFVTYDERYMIKTMRKVCLFPEASTFQLHSAELAVKQAPGPPRFLLGHLIGQTGLTSEFRAVCELTAL